MEARIISRLNTINSDFKMLGKTLISENQLRDFISIYYCTLIVCKLFYKNCLETKNHSYEINVNWKECMIRFFMNYTEWFTLNFLSVVKNYN